MHLTIKRCPQFCHFCPTLNSAHKLSCTKTVVRDLKNHVYLHVLTLRHRFCDWEEKWQLLHVPGETSISRRHTPVQLLVAAFSRPCLLSLKNDRKQRKRGGSLFERRQAPEAATERCLANKNKLIHKVLTALRAALFMKKQMAQEGWTVSLQCSWITFSLFLSGCCHPVILVLCIPR